MSPLVSRRYWLLLLWLLLAPVGGAVLWALVAVTGMRTSDSLIAPLSGALAVVLLLVIVMAIRWRPLVRAGVAEARHPGAVVVDALRTNGDAEVFSRVIGTREPSLRYYGYVVAFDDVGMHVYLGGRDAEERLSVAWAHVHDVREIRVMPRARWVAGLEVRFESTAGPVALPLAPLALPGTALSAAAVRRLLTRIQASRPH